MKRILWEQAEKAERVRICAFYSAYLAKAEGRDMTVEELDEAWEGCWYDVIKYTFGPDSWEMQEKMDSVQR
jgi:hypothetical protein